MERYGFHNRISIQASVKTRTGGRAVDRSTNTRVREWLLFAPRKLCFMGTKVVLSFLCPFSVYQYYSIDQKAITEKKSVTCIDASKFFIEPLCCTFVY